MLISAGEGFEGYKITEYKDIVIGTASTSEGAGYRHIAIKKACQAAEKLNANAIINMNMSIYPIAEKTQEATVYANAVVVEALKNASKYQENNAPNIQTSADGFIKESGEYKFVVCPKCGTKYKTDIDEEGKLHVKGFNDVDDIEPGLQIFCLRCGTKFTVPGTK